MLFPFPLGFKDRDSNSDPLPAKLLVDWRAGMQIVEFERALLTGSVEDIAKKLKILTSKLVNIAMESLSVSELPASTLLTATSMRLLIESGTVVFVPNWARGIIAEPSPPYIDVHLLTIVPKRASGEGVVVGGVVPGVAYLIELIGGEVRISRTRPTGIKKLTVVDSDFQFAFSLDGNPCIYTSVAEWSIAKPKQVILPQVPKH